jgi:hypothetical protein
VILISSLFIILSAKLTVQQVSLFSLQNWLFVGALIIVVRPVAVFLSTLRSAVSAGERLFLAWMAPRGVVAAAVISVFATRLSEAGFPGYERLVSLTFQVIVGTVTVYGLTASRVARRLKLAQPDPQGVLFVGADPWTQSIAALLADEGFALMLVDSNWENIRRARAAGLRAHYANILSEDALYDLPLDGIGRLLSMTPNDEVNALAALHFLDVFGRSQVYQLPPASKSRIDRPGVVARHLQARYLFDESATFANLQDRFRRGATPKRTTLTAEFGLQQLKTMYGESATPLFLINQSRRLQVWTVSDPPKIETGQTLISLVDPAKREDRQ